MGNEQSISKRTIFNIVPDKFEAITLLGRAESRDLYLQECYDDRANSIARRNMTYTPNHIGLRDLNYGRAYLDSMLPEIPQRLTLDLYKVNIIQLMPTADGGMPHTRPGDIICYPDISQLFSKTTLLHELWHIHQRNYQDLWHKVFKRLGWVPWTGKLPEQLENNRRYNPDTIDSPFWIYDDKWVPIPVFRDITHPKVSDVDIWFYHPAKNYHVKRIPDEIQSYFGNLVPAAFEHPREITAYMLSEPEKHTNSRAFANLLESVGNNALPTKTT